ncbi:MobQ family relaxase [Priestia koreensis]|uniref:MobA/MobL protein domain-containing protein n=1 Tax=Priestia koreensis TaxID=284581 RepID=A0A0M0KZB5_9BACI|nr:MobQ family relaxase [Priestia koreensis]KOO43753.1 hypothetical protein AMD01_15460 [Priestia koreensis]
MAIYHFSAQVISRSRGQSAVASAAYRSGERLLDERTGENKYYARKVQPEAIILSPSQSPSWVYDRNRLWNEVEKAETRKNSQLAREINIALPRELSANQQTDLIKQFVQSQFVNKGMIADIAIHRDDKENPHAHVMLTTREISKDGFTVKNRDWNDRKLLNQWREQWANYANQALDLQGVNERISHLSHEARGLEQLPTIHLGHVAASMEKEGKKTNRGTINRERQEYNRVVTDLQAYREEKARLQKEIVKEKKDQHFLTPAEKIDITKAVSVVKGYVTIESIEKRREQINQWKNGLSQSQNYLDWKHETFEKAQSYIDKQEYLQNAIKHKQEGIKEINWLNPLKIRENRFRKERFEKELSKLQSDYQAVDEKLNYYREKLNFSNVNEFFIKARDFKIEYDEKTNSIHKQKQEIKTQTVILNQAEKAIKQSKIREIVSIYPNLKTTGQYVSYETAMKLKEIKNKTGKYYSIESIKSIIQARHEVKMELTEQIKNINKELQRIRTAELYYKQLEQLQHKIDKIGENPFLKGKIMFSKERKNEYKQDLEQLKVCKKMIAQLGFEDKESFISSKNAMDTTIAEKSKAEKYISHAETGNYKSGAGLNTSFLESIIQGIEHAKQLEEQDKLKKGNRKKKERRIER